MSIDVTRMAAQALQKGVRDARVWGWRFLHVSRAETPHGVSYAIGTVLCGWSFQLSISAGHQ